MKTAKTLLDDLFEQEGYDLTPALCFPSAMLKKKRKEDAAKKSSAKEVQEASNMMADSLRKTAAQLSNPQVLQALQTDPKYFQRYMLQLSQHLGRAAQELAVPLQANQRIDHPSDELWDRPGGLYH